MVADPASGADSLLLRSRQSPRLSTQRKLLLAAGFSEVALEDAVLVGGTAVELHTGSYRPTDIDLVGRRRAGAAQQLEDLGFRKSGRHWIFEFDDGETLAIEVPDSHLGDFAVEPAQMIDLDPGRIAVIALDDLMMDRLLQATGGEPVTMAEAVRLATAAYERIDWDGLASRADAAAVEGSLAGTDLPKVLEAARKRARRNLRG